MTGRHRSPRGPALFAAGLAAISIATLAGVPPAGAQAVVEQDIVEPDAAGGRFDTERDAGVPPTITGEAAQPSQNGISGAPGRDGSDPIAQRLRAIPQGWVRIGYDFDRDGQFDAFEDIHSVDIQQARSGSEGRRGDGTQPMDGRTLPSEERREARARTTRIEGRLLDTFTVNLVGLSEPHVIGNVRTDDGRLERVDLGPQNQVRELNLRRNDPVTITATRGLLNDRPVFVARQVEARGVRIAVDQPGSSGGLRRVNGRILNTRLASFEGHLHEHLLAQVRLDNGRIETVDLGSVNNLSRGVTLRRGDRVSLLVHPAWINDEPALLAAQIRTPLGQVVWVDISEGREELRLRGTPVSPEEQRIERNTGERGPDRREGPGRGTRSSVEVPPSTRPAR